ncbi:hypothetical protein BRD06_01900 [Halobacteriales archaeon QS_9_67_15]|nr:MAG: hypothetical protein BRD06_01900 [Halobacteriales archaeon QS_9_67_15]
MVEDLPTDVRTVLEQLFTEGRRALEADDLDTARESVTSAQSVAANKLPESELRGELLHGCERIAALLDADGDTEPAAAAEYLAAMERRLAAVE